VGRAFVVNHWYITAYEPIKNIAGEIIGMLYVGMLEKPYIDLRNSVMLTFTGIAALCTVILLIILFFITSGITDPLRRMVLATKPDRPGRPQPSGPDRLPDEVGQLAHSFNQMTENLKLANENLIQWGKTLEKRWRSGPRSCGRCRITCSNPRSCVPWARWPPGRPRDQQPLTSILINTHLMLEKLEKKARVL